MTVKEYLSKLGFDLEKSCQQICFVIGEVKEDRTIYYRTSPLNLIWEINSFSKKTTPNKDILNYKILNNKQPVVSWLSGANWNPGIESGRYMSLLVMSEEELTKYYSKIQWESMERYIDAKIEEEISNLRINQALSCM